ASAVARRALRPEPKTASSPAIGVEAAASARTSSGGTWRASETGAVPRAGGPATLGSFASFRRPGPDGGATVRARDRPSLGGGAAAGGGPPPGKRFGRDLGRGRGRGRCGRGLIVGGVRSGRRRAWSHRASAHHPA